MRASELLGRHVVDTAGRQRGVVIELLAAQPQPPGLPGLAVEALTIEALVVSPRRLGSMLGYGREQQRGPLLVRSLVERLHRRSVVIPWSSVQEVGDTVVVVAAAGEQAGTGE